METQLRDLKVTKGAGVGSMVQVEVEQPEKPNSHLVSDGFRNFNRSHILRLHFGGCFLGLHFWVAVWRFFWDCLLGWFVCTGPGPLGFYCKVSRKWLCKKATSNGETQATCRNRHRRDT